MVAALPLAGQSEKFLSRFKEIWGIDFEFRAPPGERPIPVCMVAREIQSGRLIRLWQDELHALGHPPFDIGPESLTVAYYASAEMGCFLALGWPMPANVLDLYVEHRRETNGLSQIGGDGLSGALIVRGLGSMVQADKPAMREMILGHEDYSSEQRDAILTYCQGCWRRCLALIGRARSIAPATCGPLREWNGQGFLSTSDCSPGCAQIGRPSKRFSLRKSTGTSVYSRARPSRLRDSPPFSISMAWAGRD
jgi:hypothetical protein